MTNRSYQRAVPPKGMKEDVDPENLQDQINNKSSFESGNHYYRGSL